MQKIGWRSYWLQAKDPIRCVKAIQKSLSGDEEINNTAVTNFQLQNS